MKKKVYDTTKFAERIDGALSLKDIKSDMLEAIGNIAVAVHDRNANLALEIQTDLMWVFEIFGTIEEREVEI